MTRALILLIIFSCSIASSFGSSEIQFDRFDLNQNLALEERELENLFTILRPSIVEKLNLNDQTLKYAKSAFLVLILNPDLINADSNSILLKISSFDLCYKNLYCKKNYLDPIQVNEKQFYGFIELL